MANSYIVPVRRCNPWCTPFIIYLVISTLSILFTLLMPNTSDEDEATFVGSKITGLLVQIIFILFWSMIYYYLCYTCNKGWAWFLLLFPYLLIMFAIFFFFIFVNVGAHKKFTRLRVPNK